VRDLNYDLKTLAERNRDGSYATQSNRHRILQLIANQLHEAGFKKLRAVDLKGRHIQALLERWQRDDLAAATIKNRMAVVRWWAEKVGKASVVARDNAHYGIPDRNYVTNQTKATDFNADDLAKVKDPHVKMSLELQRAFGLRREEAIKFQPHFADQGDHIALKSTWTKGGKPREIPIRNEAQREVLNRAHKLAGKQSLIPSDRTYIQQLKIYERHSANAGLSKMHGLRHLYAQQRYLELTSEFAAHYHLPTGWPAPAAGGPKVKALSPLQKQIDTEVRLAISLELGHERKQITGVYLGT
jgi:site-specific recombinase XerC